VERLATDEHVERDHLAGEMKAAVRAAVARLPSFERRLIERRFFEDAPIARIAAELGVSRQSLGERQRKALRRLRTTLDPSIDAAHT
jgi:RNA polymerase sigma factor (sigma-70 family)